MLMLEASAMGARGDEARVGKRDVCWELYDVALICAAFPTVGYECICRALDGFIRIGFLSDTFLRTHLALIWLSHLAPHC